MLDPFFRIENMHNRNGYHLTGTGDPDQFPVIRTKPGKLTLNKLLTIGITSVGVVACIVIFKIYINSHVSVTEQRKDLVNGNTSSRNFHNESLLEERVVGIEKEGKGTSYEKQIMDSLSQSEKEMVEQFRAEIQAELTHDYMNPTSYLSKWLKAQDWNLQDAKEMLLNHLAWRKELDIDSVNEGNFTYFEQEFRYFADGHDFQGRPVISSNVEDWDMRKASIAGYERQFLRYIYREYERQCAYLRECQAKGMNISQVIYIINVDKFNFNQHGCLSCISTLTKYIFGVDDNYPGIFNHLFIINVSDVAEFLVEMVVPYLSGENGAAAKVFGTKKEEWQREILSFIPADQIRREFGGTKADDVHV